MSVAMNYFDAAVYFCLCVAIVMGFNAGLLRSLATILGYLVALPFALIAVPHFFSGGNGKLVLAAPQSWAILFLIFLATGFVLGAAFRLTISQVTGPDINIADRAAGATLGAVRVLLLAMLMVLIFDRIIPANSQPAFLTDSRLRPILSVAGQQGVKSLPPEVAGYIDRLKQERGI
jgi:membrane protein required for colicin V production